MQARVTIVPVASGTFDVRITGGTPKVQTYAVEAGTPVEAAMEVFFRIFETVPEVVELNRHVEAGRTVTTVRLAAGDVPDGLDLEVELGHSGDG